VEHFLEAVPADVRHGGPHAFHFPFKDYIQLPHPEHFTSVDKYHATRLHETVHWTGHESRLNRKFGERFGDDAYAFEELIAELGGAFLSAHLGIATELHHADYIASWLKLLKDHNRAIVSAAAHASAAAEYLIKGAALAREPEVVSA
jgi:antirestriction protein ArdC